MMGILSWFGKRATECLAAGVFLGLVLPDLAAAARPLLVPAIAMMLTLSLLRLDPAGVVGALRRPRLVVPAIGYVLLVSPLLGFAAATVLDLDPGIAVALVVWSASPPLISVPAIATLVGLDGALALTVTTAAGLLVPVTLPPIVFALLGLDLEIGPAALMLRLALLLAGTAAIAAVIRHLAGTARLRRHAAAIDGSFVLVMLLFAVAVLDGVTAAALATPARVAGLLALVFGASLVMQLLGWLVFRIAGARAATTLSLACGNRNMALVLGAAPAAFDPDSFLFLALLQFPIYLLPVILRPVYRYASGQGWRGPENRG